MFELSTAKRVTNHLLSLTKKYPDNFKLYEVLCQWSYFLWRLPEEKEEKLKGVQVMRLCAHKLREIAPEKTEAFFWPVFVQAVEVLTLGVLETFHRMVGIKALLDQAQTLNPTYFSSAPFWFTGRVYFKLPGFPLSIGDPEKAEQYLEEAVKRSPGFAAPYLFLAETKLFLGKKEEGYKLLDQIPKVKPATYFEKYAKWPVINQAKAFREVVETGKYDRFRWDPQLTPVPPPPADW